MGSISRKEYQRSLPTKRVSAGCLLFDHRRRLLLVEPAYKRGWEIPGGVVEAGESPWQASRREVMEELGLSVRPARLLCVDYSGETRTRTESLNFIFDGGILSQNDIDQIKLPDAELRAFQLLDPAEALRLLNGRLRRRVEHCLKVLEGGTGIYLDEQVPIQSPEA